MGIVVEKGHNKVVNLGLSEEEHTEGLELNELRAEVKRAEIRLQETKFKALRDGTISFEDTMRIAERLSERDKYEYSSTDVVTMWMEDKLTFEDFLPETEAKKSAPEYTLEEMNRYLDEMIERNKDDPDVADYHRSRKNLLNNREVL